MIYTEQQLERFSNPAKALDCSNNMDIGNLHFLR